MFDAANVWLGLQIILAAAFTGHAIWEIRTPAAERNKTALFLDIFLAFFFVYMILFPNNG